MSPGLNWQELKIGFAGVERTDTEGLAVEEALFTDTWVLGKLSLLAV